MGNVAKVHGGIQVFGRAKPDDGLLEFGLVTAKNPVQWARALARVAQGRAAESPFIKVTWGKRFQARFDHPLPCELDGGARTEVKKMRIKVHPGSIKICVLGHLLNGSAEPGRSLLITDSRLTAPRDMHA